MESACSSGETGIEKLKLHILATTWKPGKGPPLRQILYERLPKLLV